jgi:hypothetical protein
MTIMDYLPGISNTLWKYSGYAVTPTKTVTVPKYTGIYSVFADSISDQQGFLLSFQLGCNSPDLVFEVTIDNTTLKASLKQIYESYGSGYYIPYSPWISMYDTTNNVYVVNFNTDMAFRHNVHALATNPTASPIIITDAVLRVVLVKQGFYKALADLKLGKA